MKLKSKELPAGLELITFESDSNQSLLDDIGKLRCKVWQNLKLPITVDLSSGYWFDDDDTSSKHYAVLAKSGSLVASSRLTLSRGVSSLRQSDWFDNLTKQPQEPVAFISRLVVDLKFQKKGIGRFLDNKCIEDAKIAGAKSVFCDVPEYRIKGLEQVGFEVVQNPKLGVVFPTLKWAAMSLSINEV